MTASSARWVVVAAVFALLLLSGCGLVDWGCTVGGIDTCSISSQLDDDDDDDDEDDSGDGDEDSGDGDGDGDGTGLCLVDCDDDNDCAPEEDCTDGFCRYPCNMTNCPPPYTCELLFEEVLCLPTCSQTEECEFIFGDPETECLDVEGVKFCSFPDACEFCDDDGLGYCHESGAGCVCDETDECGGGLACTVD